MHLNEDDLILHYYGEAEPNERGVETHLSSCADCSEAFTRLRRVMEAIDAAPVPEPSRMFEQNVWARLAPAIEGVGREVPRAARPASSGWRAWFAGPRLALVGGLAAIVVAVGAVRYATTGAGPEEMAPKSDADVREQVLLTAVSDHIEQSQLVLVELANAEPQEGALDVSFERTTADELVSSGRLYRETARQTGDLHLAQLLDDLELVLVDIARGPEALSQDQLKEIRAQIEEQELIFKLRVLAADVKKRQEAARTSQAPATPKRTL